MLRFATLLVILFLSLAMAVTQHLALEYYWYWTYWWLDLLMHGAGGIVIGLCASLFARRWATLFAIVIVVGIFWELFELVIGVSLREPNFALDTSLDLLFDVLGALVAYGIIVWWPKSPSPFNAGHGASPDQTSS